MSKSIAEQQRMPVIKNTERTMVMLECENINHDYKSKHIDELFSFLCSLEFDVSIPKDAFLSSYIIIDGAEFSVDSDSASTMSRNPYTKKIVPRRKRCIVIRKSFRGNAACTILINKEIDKLKLVNKIKAAIKEKADKAAENEKREKDTEDFLTALFNRYSTTITGFKSLNVKKGLLTLDIDKLGCVTVDSNGEISGCKITMPEVNTVEDVMNFPIEASVIKTRLMVVQIQIKELGTTGITDSSPEGKASFYEGKIYFR